ncbi:MAG: FAD-binding oxidoreductase [Nitrosopumilaceae archaeon]
METKKIGRDIQKIVKGQVFWDKQMLDLYSVDSSSYLLRPRVVVFPKDEHDIVKILKYAAKSKISVTPRGAGTGLVGSALGNGIILDLRHFDKIKIGSNYVEAGSGVFKGNLDKELEKRGRFFPPNPSIGPYCTVGGMIATNASGSHSLKYGSTIDNLLGIRIIASNGNIVQLPSNSQFANNVFRIIKSSEYKKFPSVSKNSCGYRVDKIASKSDLQKIIAGSEGTLGVIVSAKLKTLPIPKQLLLVILAYETVRQAAIDSAKIVNLKPSALEIVDYNIIKHIKARFPKYANYLLFVEFDSDVKKSKINLQKIISSSRIINTLTKKDEVKKWWGFRNAALSYSLRSITTKESMPTVIEDAVVPVGKLVSLVDIIEKISKKYRIKFVLYGHAGNGNLHIRPILKRKNKSLIKKISQEFFYQVIKTGGCITGEHGDGLARSEFVKLQYGNDTYSVFNKIKNEFDPKNILNRGKIITTESTITKNLRV